MMDAGGFHTDLNSLACENIHFCDGAYFLCFIAKMDRENIGWADCVPALRWHL